MTDLEITRACALAMGGELSDSSGRSFLMIFDRESGGIALYDPLHDDAQAMGLVKRFRLDCIMNHSNGIWLVRYANAYAHNFMWDAAIGDDLNRAICMAVTKL